ncbi:MICOS complex subunit MIC13 [Triplophysa rosa]|uniref:MICOS complex subunit MIC13 n=1 Tax=Triplophysa rosa TaxID=992332 RepID=A0A9W7T6R9_TRIRA|nr:MICOS complex subunit MIC13 [Triplophysa rosa]KAI7791306.1 protein QIL1 [Triplophysa rosa]
MAAKILPVVKLATKVTIAGGAIYVAYDSGLLGGGEEGSVALARAKAAVPPAVEEWMKYFGFELPATPKIEFSPLDAWNSGVQKSIHALSVAPSTMSDYSKQGLQYLKDLSK